MLLGTGGTIPVRSIKACVVYERDTGRIRHIHHSITLEGGQETTDEQLERNALNIVAKRHPDPKALNVLGVRHQDIDPNRRYRVDTAAEVLVQLPDSPG